MKEIYYTYNNEAIASCVMLQALQQIQTIDIARSFLILPFLLDDRTVNYLQNANTDNMSLSSFINNRPRLFTSFNNRFLALLPITINALMMLSKGNQIEITPDIILKNNILSDNVKIGNRFAKIKQALPIMFNMISKYETPQLYQLLNIQL